MSNEHSNLETPAAIDGVARLPATGISVVISGGGIGGLFFALEAYRQGHNVVAVLERASAVEAIGDTFSLLPPALSTLRYFPEMKNKFETECYDALFSFWRYEGRPLNTPVEAEWNAPGVEHPAKGVRVPWIERRSNIVNMLYEQCLRLNLPILFNQQATAYAEDDGKAWVTAKDGSIYAADVVVAADGVGTKSHAHVTGQAVRAVSSGYALYRLMVPMEHLRQHVSQECQDRYLNDERPQFRVVLAHDMHANLITSPYFANIVLTHKDDGESDESWRATVSSGDVLETLSQEPGWDPLFQEIVAAAPPKSVIDWKLLWRDPQSQWASPGGRVVQLGDSAHSFLPTSGNGATQAMEDCISLATCLRLGGRKGVAESTKAHARLRFERVGLLQKFGFVNREHWHNMDLDATEKDPSLLIARFGRWAWGHDPLAYAEARFEEAVRWVREGGEFQSTNLPPGYNYEPWTVAEELKREKRGEPSGLFAQGDWS